MKTKLDIGNEVVAILKRRGFDTIWWAEGPYSHTIKHGGLWWLHYSEICNRLGK